MKWKNFLSTLAVLVFAFAYRVSSTAVDWSKTVTADNPEAKRVIVERVSQYSSEFLSDMKIYPTIDLGNDLYIRLEMKEPSDDDKAMNAARKATGETPAVKESAKRKLAALLKNDGTLNAPWQNDAWLVRFLRLKNYDVPKTYKLIKSYYNFKANHGIIYDNLLPTNVRDAAKTEIAVALPKRDPAGARIILSPLKNWDPKKYSIHQMLRYAAVLAETGMYEPATQLAGVQIIFDTAGLTWQHVKQVNPQIAKMMIQWVLTSAPVKIAGVHILNQSRIFAAMFNIFKPFLTEELRNKIHFHGSNMKSLYRYIPATSLPDTLGGSYPKPSFSSYEWDLMLQAGDGEFAKIASYGIKSKA